MPLDALRVCAAARLALGDLVEIDRQMTEGGELNAQWILLVKQSFISVANVADLERGVRQAYQANPELSVEFKRLEKKFTFAKYIRNKLIGHVNDELIDKAIEWKPELRTLLPDNTIEANFLVNLFILETTLNTYVDKSEKHLVFEGDTDLLYPPNWTRFLIFLIEIVRGAMTFLSLLIEAIRPSIPPPPSEVENFSFFKAAGLTTFRYIAK